MAFFRKVVSRIASALGFGFRMAREISVEDWAESNSWLHVIPGGSTYVTAVRYNKHSRHLIVRFTTGGQCTYTNIDITLARAMARSDSLGRFVRRVLYWRDYLEKHGVHS